MSEISEPTTQPVVSTTAADRPAEVPVTEGRERRSSRAVQAAAWVGIVAGTVFVVAVIFFSGFILGKQAEGGGRGFDGPPRHHHEMTFGEGRPGPPMFRQGPGEYGPGPGTTGPAQQPPTPPTPPSRP